MRKTNFLCVWRIMLCIRHTFFDYSLAFESSKSTGLGRDFEQVENGEKVGMAPYSNGLQGWKWPCFDKSTLQSTHSTRHKPVVTYFSLFFFFFFFFFNFQIFFVHPVRVDRRKRKNKIASNSRGAFFTSFPPFFEIFFFFLLVKFCQISREEVGKK